MATVDIVVCGYSVVNVSQVALPGVWQDDRVSNPFGDHSVRGVGTEIIHIAYRQGKSVAMDVHDRFLQRWVSAFSYLLISFLFHS